MTDLSELIARVEAATGPDREIDRAIKEAFGHDWDYSADWDYWDAIKREKASRPVAKLYTGSLDAAMTLVDPRALWAHGSMEDGPFARLCWPQPNGGFVGGYVEANAATVPLAICLAALSAQNKDGDCHG